MNRQATEHRAIKDLGNDKIGAYGVLFGTPEQTDLDGHYFDADTDFWLDKWDTRPMIYGHGSEGMKGSPVVGVWDSCKQDDVGIWFEGQLDKAHKYYEYVKELVDKGVLKMSSDSVTHLLRGQKDKDTGALHYDEWPIVAVSLTTIPCEPRMMPVEAVKSAFKSIKVDLGDVIDEPALPSFKAMHLSEGVEVQATMEAVRSLNSNLMYNALYSCVDAWGESKEMPLSQRISTWKLCVDEFRDISTKVMEAILTGVSTQSAKDAAEHIQAWKHAAAKVDKALAAKSYGEELDEALAAISGVVERGAAIKQDRAAEPKPRTIGKESREKIEQLSSALKSLAEVPDASQEPPAEPQAVGLTDEMQKEALRLQAVLLKARTEPLLGVHTNG